MANRLHAGGLLSTGAIKKNNYAATAKQEEKINVI